MRCCDDDSGALIGAEAFRDDTRHADWYQPYIGELEHLCPPLQRIVDELNERREQDGL